MVLLVPSDFDDGGERRLQIGGTSRIRYLDSDAMSILPPPDAGRSSGFDLPSPEVLAKPQAARDFDLPLGLGAADQRRWQRIWSGLHELREGFELRKTSAASRGILPSKSRSCKRGA